MPNLTKNYGLKKPLSEEFYDVNVQNDNMDIIDAELNKRATLVNGKVPEEQLPDTTYIPVTSEVPEDADIWIDPDDTTVEKDHIINTNNPHNVTIEQIGAAPAGDYATKSFVSNKIAEAQLGGDSSDIDLSGYATKDDIAQLSREKAQTNHSHTAYEIGARPSTWTPTAVEVGAAPYGYGLGRASGAETAIEDCDSAIYNGWYNVHNTAANKPFTVSGMMRVDSYNANNVVQTFFTPNLSQSYTATVRRECFNGVWSEWEWIDPPMVLGIEYRTTKRWKGQPVYRMAVEFGALPNKTTKSVTYNATNTDYTPISYGLLTSSKRVIISTGYDDYISMNTPIVVVVGAHDIKVTTTVDMSTHTATAWVEYTK